MSATQEVRRLVEDSETKPVSQLLRRAVRVAQKIDEPRLELWCRLPADGYLAGNPATGEDIMAPECRSVVGQHSDIYSRPFVVAANLPFVNENRLRFGAAELEQQAQSDKVPHAPGQRLHDPML